MKGFKTISAASVIAAIGMVQQSGAVDLIPEQYKGIVLIVIGGLMGGLRVATDSSIFQKY